MDDPTATRLRCLAQPDPGLMMIGTYLPRLEATLGFETKPLRGT